MSAPTVSVVIATYNFAPYIAAAIDSVLAQDYPADAIEIIVVDDGSTDGTAEAVLEQRRRNPRIRLVRHKEASAA